MKRRQFISLIGSAAAWPLAARAQQGERARRIGVLMNVAADDKEGQARIAAFLQVLQQLGWTDGGNVRIDYRWAAGDAGSFQRYAEELLALAPDVILASATPSVQALQRATRTVPIVFAQVGDPVGMGAVASLARRCSAARQSRGRSRRARSRRERCARSSSRIIWRRLPNWVLKHPFRLHIQ